METNVLDERLKFVAAYESGQWSMTELCERYGVTRPTGYKWLARHREAGRAGLADRSRAPHRCPHRTSDAAEALIVEARQEYGWGGPRSSCGSSAIGIRRGPGRLAVRSTTSSIATNCSTRTGAAARGRTRARSRCRPTTRITYGRPISKGSSRLAMDGTAIP